MNGLMSTVKQDQREGAVPAGTRWDLVKKIVWRILLLVLILGAMLFLPAGSFRYWQAWTYLAVVFLPFLVVITVGLFKVPELLERRLRMKEKEKKQQAIMKLAYPAFLAQFLLPGFDRRFGWSMVPVALVIAADVVVLVSYLWIVHVLWENRYASRIVEVDKKQTVIDTGPYAVVRHPMYSGVLPMYVISPLALGSFWALIPALLVVAAIIARIFNEEEVLSRDLDGYAAYMRRVKYRLIPGIW